MELPALLLCVTLNITIVSRRGNICKFGVAASVGQNYKKDVIKFFTI